MEDFKLDVKKLKEHGEVAYLIDLVLHYDKLVQSQQELLELIIRERGLVEHEANRQG